MPHTHPARLLLLTIALIPALLQGCSSGSSTTTPGTDPPAPQFTVGGAVNGLNGEIRLNLNGGTSLVIDNDGSFTFATTLASGATYAVTLVEQPAGQTCTLANANGTIAAANVTVIAVTCIDDLYTIGGIVSGLASGSLELRLNDAELLAIPGNGGFTFTTTLVNGAPYEITVATQSAGQICSIPDGSHSGIIAASNVTNILVQCLPDADGLSITPIAIKTLRLDWQPAAGATAYRLLENPDGISGYSEIASLEADQQTYDHRVFLPGRINADYLLEACDDDDCTESPTAQVSGTLREAIGYFKASTPGIQNLFGTTLSLSADGHTLAVGAWGEGSAATGIDGDESHFCGLPLEDRVNCALDSGAVYIYQLTDTGWQRQAYIKASNTGAGDFFGYSIALSADGNTLAVGAWGEDSGATGINGNEINDCDLDEAEWLNCLPGSGAAYVFTRNAGTWSQQAYFKASNTDQTDVFGFSVALSGSGKTLAVGAPGEGSGTTGINGNQNDDCHLAEDIRTNCAPNSGAAYVFRSNAGDWTQQAYVKASNTGDEDRFGASLALSANGSALAIGALGEDSGATGINGNQSDDCHLSEGERVNCLPGSGAVYLLTRSAGEWSQQAYLKASNTGANDGFGTDLALSADGTVLAIGSHHEDGDMTGVIAALPHGSEDNEAATDSGAVYVFSRSGNDWTQQAYIKASNTGANDLFGTSVSLSDDGVTLAIGASGEDGSSLGIYAASPHGSENNNDAAGSGAAYVFIRDAGAWRQQAYLKAPNTRTGDAFGIAVALAGDGQSLAVGAIGEDSGSTNVGGDQVHDCELPEANRQNCVPNSGAVYLY